jgi:two-component system, OmpR family, sensor kinase
VNPVLCYVRARLQRRLFIWFGVTILLTVVAVSWVIGVTGNGEAGWRREVQRISTFVGGRFERVWDSPADRDELARAMSRDLDATIVLEGTDLQPLATFGLPCHKTPMRLAIKRDGQVIGHFSACAERLGNPQRWRVALALLVTGLILWTMSSRISRRLSRPMGELGRVASELAAGNFAARVQLDRRHRFGEAAALSLTINDMAARIQRHLAEQRELLAAVSHELRTPLARVRLLTEMARDRGATVKTLDDLDREVMEMDALVGDLLASSRMDFAAVSRRPLDAVEAASRALERAGADPTALIVEREHDEGGPIPIQADATLLARALANLIDNARRHGGGVEALKVKRANGHVVFEVDDHGEGFVAGEEGRVFEPFYRRSEQGSLGLGLSLVKRIAEAHGGRAYAANREGGGAMVGVELPVEASERAAPRGDGGRAEPS